MFHNAADFAVFAFTNGDGQPGIGWHLLVQTRQQLIIMHPVNGDAMFQLSQLLRVYLTKYTHPVFSEPACAWQFQMTCQFPIIGQQEQAF